MDSIYLLIPVALIFTAIAISAFFWAVNNKQYDDLDSEGERILFDEPVNPKQPSESSTELRND